MTLQAFISYKSEYRDFAAQLREAIQAWGHRAWLDIVDIPAGTHPGSKGWDDAIHQGMRSSQVVIGVLTPESLKSENVLDEWGWALENNRRLFLLWLRDVDSEDIPPRYVRIQRIDLRKDVAQGFKRLQQALASPGLIAPSDDVGTRNGASAPPPPSTPKDDNRARMIQNVRDSWIKGVLEPALQGTEFDLGMTLKPDAVLKHADFGDYALPTTAGILQVFDDLGKELLILGAPGAGKTILLLQLARELLNRAENDPRQPIPVVLNLSSWAADRKPLHVWLTERLRLEYGVPKKLATHWQENENLLLLLDGLDEVNEDYRNDCVLAINAYRQRHYNLIPIVVCSRLADYDLLTSRLILYSAVLLQELTDEQIDTQIRGEHYSALRQAMVAEPQLRNLAKTPFLLNAISCAYRDRTFGEIEQLESKSERVKHILDRYTKYLISKKLNAQYSIFSIRNWLTWLASQVIKLQETKFYIEQLQLSWVINIRYVLITFLTSLAIYSILFFICGYMIAGVSFGINLGFLMGVIGGLIATFEQSKPAEKIIWRTKGLLFAFVLVFLNFFLLIGVSLSINLKRINDTLAFVVITTFSISSVYSFFYFSVRQFATKENVFQRFYPGHGIRHTIFNIFRLILLIAPVFIVIIYISSEMVSLLVDREFVGWLNYATKAGLSSAVAISFLFGGGRFIIKHFILRIILTRAGYAPWNYAAFLDYCASVGILRKVGGGYIFAHRMLLEYFAGLAEEKGNTGV